jgi:two-component system nitrogen regulation sensor histidine kinase GlnL
MISLDSVINSLKESILIFDKKTVIIFVNKTGEELLRKSSKDILGKKFSSMVQGKESISPLIKKTIAEGRTFRGKSVTLHIGQSINIDFNLSPFLIKSNISGALLSISENINISDNNDYDFDSVDFLLGSLAHEIKNPLGGIKGAAQLLRNKTQGACIDEYVDLIVRETDRLNVLLQDYLNVWKRSSFNPVNIHEILEQSLTLMHTAMQKSGISLKRSYDPSLPLVKGDEGRLLQVFLNIIKNGLESMKKGGRLDVSTYLSGELFREHGKSKRMAVVSIRDTGKGISERDTRKIFIPFYTNKKKGVGIGLAVSKKIIKDHGGFIRVKSQQKKGTTFLLYIPFGSDE